MNQYLLPTVAIQTTADWVPGFRSTSDLSSQGGQCASGSDSAPGICLNCEEKFENKNKLEPHQRPTHVCHELLSHQWQKSNNIIDYHSHGQILNASREWTNSICLIGMPVCLALIHIDHNWHEDFLSYLHLFTIATFVIKLQKTLFNSSESIFINTLIDYKKKLDYQSVVFVINLQSVVFIEETHKTKHIHLLTFLFLDSGEQKIVAIIVVMKSI